MRQYLLDTFHYNDVANKKQLVQIAQLKDKTEAIKLYCHLINSQRKWMARIMQDPKSPSMSWWEPVYKEEELYAEWKKSLTPWIDYINANTEEAIREEVTFSGYDGGKWAATPLDIMLQLNYHSIYHRAQIQTIIRQQGLEPDFVDYIGTKYRKLS